MSERNEVSRHEVEVFRVLLTRGATWNTNTELAVDCRDVAPRTVRAVTHKLVSLGLVDQAEVFPAHKFRLSPKGDRRNRPYMNRLRQAADIFGLVLP